MENEKLTKEFLEFLELYQSENYGEHLHEALYHVSQELLKYNLEGQVLHSLFQIRWHLNRLTEYLPESSLMIEGQNPIRLQK